MTHLPRLPPIEVRGISASGSARLRAFTLIELLVTIAVIAILLALALPSMRQTRDSAASTKSLALLRQAQIACDLYANDHRDLLMYFATPGDPTGTIELFGTRRPGYPKYFLNQSAWSISALKEYLIPLAPYRIDPVAPDENPDRPFTARTFFTCTAFAAPDFWKAPNGAADLSLLHATSRDQVAFPSLKGSWLDIQVGPFAPAGATTSTRLDYHVACFDGSARISSRQDATDFLAVQPLFGEPPPFFSMTTESGLQGRDFR